MSVHYFQKYIDTAWRSSNIKIFIHSKNIFNTYSGTELVFEIEGGLNFTGIIHSSKLFSKLLLVSKGTRDFNIKDELNQTKFANISTNVVFTTSVCGKEIFQRKKVYAYLHRVLTSSFFVGMKNEWAIEWNNMSTCIIIIEEMTRDYQR